MPQSADGDDNEPNQRHRAEECRDPSRAARLKREQQHQNEYGQRHHVRLECRRGDLEALDRGEHRQGRRDHGVAVEQRGADDAAQYDGTRALTQGTLGQRHQRERAAFPFIVGPQQDDDVFQRDDENERPNDQRENSEHGDLVRGISRSDRCDHGFAHRIKGARTDVAVDDADRPQCERPETGAWACLSVDFGRNRAAAISSGNRGGRHWPRNLKCCSAIYRAAALIAGPGSVGLFPLLQREQSRLAPNAILRLPAQSFFGAFLAKNTSTGQTATWVPTSTTRPVGMWKKSVASLADFARAMNNRSCQRGMPEWVAGLSARRDRKNEVDIMSNCQPCLRASTSAFGTLGDSM